MNNHKSRIWRDIDKHPLPDRATIDVKVFDGSILIGCDCDKRCQYPVSWKSVVNLTPDLITQWRDS